MEKGLITIDTKEVKDYLINLKFKSDELVKDEK